MELEITCSEGGPVIAIPCGLADKWGGFEDREDDDYNKACDKKQNFVSFEYGGLGWVPVADGIALVFDEEITTAFLPTPYGGVFIRNFGEEFHPELFYEPENYVSKSVDVIPEDKWNSYPKNLVLKQADMFSFDSAYPGASSISNFKPRSQVILCKLEAGEYKISYCEPNKGSIYYIKLELQLSHYKKIL